MSSIHTSGYDICKRLCDVTLSALALLFLLPLILGLAIAVRLRLGPPIVFRQERIGKDKQPFVLYKFRTMRTPDPTQGMVTNAQRMTPFGNRLRATSLDELPSLINVLRGDMSIIGPRPLRLVYGPRYSRYHDRRHEVRPGITGLAQAYGRNALSWNARLDLDVQYVENKSLALDIRILAKTVISVLNRTGIRENGQATASEFLGSGPPLTSRALDLSEQTSLAQFRSVAHRGAEREFLTSATPYGCFNEAGDLVAMFAFSANGSTDVRFALCVVPGKTGQGIGRQAMVHALKTASTLGLTSLTSNVSRADASGLALYSRFGFKLNERSASTYEAYRALNPSRGSQL